MLNSEKTIAIVRENLLNIKTNNPALWNLIDFFKSRGDLFLFGGSIRDFILHKKPRDYDFVIEAKIQISEDIHQFSFTKNSFGGYKILLEGTRVDIWELKDTWAFNQGLINCAKENLTKTVFFNLEAIAFEINKNIIYDNGFFDALNDKTLRIILKENPCPELCVLKAFVFKHIYQFSFSEELNEYIYSWVQNNKNPLKTLLSVQKKHYDMSIVNTETLSSYMNYYLK